MFRSLRVDDPLEIMKRVWMMPTFEVHGIAGGYQGPGVKTIIPPKATAIVSCRLVPNMNPKKIVRLVTDFVKSKNPDVKVSAEHELPAYQGTTTGPYADAIRGAMKFAFGKEPVFVREGGSIGAVLSMESVLRRRLLLGCRCRSTATTRRTRTSTGDRPREAWRRSPTTSAASRSSRARRPESDAPGRSGDADPPPQTPRLAGS